MHPRHDACWHGHLELLARWRLHDQHGAREDTGRHLHTHHRLRWWRRRSVDWRWRRSAIDVGDGRSHRRSADATTEVCLQHGTPGVANRSTVRRGRARADFDEAATAMVGVGQKPELGARLTVV